MLLLAALRATEAGVRGNRCSPIEMNDQRPKAVRKDSMKTFRLSEDGYMELQYPPRSTWVRRSMAYQAKQENQNAIYVKLVHISPERLTVPCTARCDKPGPDDVL